MNGKIMEGVSSLKYLGSCFGEAGGPQEGVSMTMMFNVRSVKRELYRRVVAPTLTYGADTWGMRMTETSYMEINCLLIMCGVTRMDAWRSRGGVTEKIGKF